MDDIARPFPTDAPGLVRERIAARRLGVRQRARALEAEILLHYRVAIQTGLLPGGAQLPAERTVAAEFGANRKSVRAALGQLAAAGLIERRPGSGSFVAWRPPAPPTSAPVFETPAVSPHDAIEARLVVEPGLCELAAARATEDAFARMEAALRTMEDAPDQVAYKESGYAFYLAVVRATRNPLLVAMYDMLVAARAKAGWGTLLPLNDREEQRRAQTGGNRAIFDALRRRDGPRARDLARAHLREMVQSIADFL